MSDSHDPPWSPEEALHQLRERKRELDEAIAKVDEKRHFRWSSGEPRVVEVADPYEPETGVVRRKMDGAKVEIRGMLPEFYSAKKLEEERRDRFQLALVTYVEAARARDAAASDALARSNNATAVASTKAATKVAWLTGVLAVAAVAQVLLTLLENCRTWSPHQ